jgi:hypothetical protein
MKYFLDTEFHEHILESRIGFGKTRRIPTIDLISIGIVSEDNRELYLLNKECNIDLIWQDSWLRQNVLSPIYCDYFHGDMRNMFPFNKRNVKRIFKAVGKTLYEIKDMLFKFIFPIEYFIPLTVSMYHEKGGYVDNDSIVMGIGEYLYRKDFFNDKYYSKESLKKANILPEFYGFFCDYDWVAICQNIFGRMNDLPEQFPMYCKDLIQSLDELEDKLMTNKGIAFYPGGGKTVRYVKSLRDFDDYPINENMHNALADAKYHLEIYKFIDNIKHDILYE